MSYFITISNNELREKLFITSDWVTVKIIPRLFQEGVVI